jgi:hypothetical protein
MRVELVIAVWGKWHIDTLTAVMLPTSLSPRNLPSLSSKYDCRLRVFTRAQDVAVLQRLAGFKYVGELMPVEFVAATDSESIPAPVHLEWWHRASQEAARNGSMILNLPPDVVFPDGCIVNLCRPLEMGKAAVLAPPQLRVVSESIVPDFEQRRQSSSIIAISPAEAVELGRRHLHPLFGEVVADCPHGRPGIEFLWPVGDQGFLLCQTTREIIACNPRRCFLTEKFLGSTLDSLTDVHMSRSADDTFFLSLAPLMKDFGLVLQELPMVYASGQRYAAVEPPAPRAGSPRSQGADASHLARHGDHRSPMARRLRLLARRLSSLPGGCSEGLRAGKPDHRLGGPRARPSSGAVLSGSGLGVHSVRCRIRSPAERPVAGAFGGRQRAPPREDIIAASGARPHRGSGGG